MLYKAKDNSTNSQHEGDKETGSSSNDNPYDPLVTAQLVAVLIHQLVSNSFDTEETVRSTFTGTRIRLDWCDSSLTGFREHLIQKLGADWYAFQEGKRSVHVTQDTIGAALADTVRNQVTAEAEKNVDVDLILRISSRKMSKQH